MSLIQYCSDRLKNSICHNLLASGVRGIGDSLPRCTGAECSCYFRCLRESLEDLSQILTAEDEELEEFGEDEKSDQQ